MAIRQQIDEVQGVEDKKVSAILKQMRSVINDITNRDSKQIVSLNPNANISGVINKINELIASIQGTQTIPPTIAQTPYGQTWKNVLANRASGTPYINSTGQIIKVSVSSGTNAGTGSTITVVINTNSGSVTIISFSVPVANGQAAAYFEVPVGATYTVTTSYAPTLWAELS